MSWGLASLHKILKDDTRQKIILLLNEKGSLGYTELLDSTEVGSTGLLNYHLKVLGDLLTKNEAGQYLLSEKGKLAFRLLKEFPEESNQLQKKKRKQYWTISAMIQIVYLISVLTLYYFGFVDSGRLVLYSILFVGSIGLCYLAYRAQGKKQPIPGSKEEKKRLKISYIIVGGMLGLATGFFGPISVILIVHYLGGPNLARVGGDSGYLWISLLVIGLVVGAIAAYWLGKRRNFKIPEFILNSL